MAQTTAEFFEQLAERGHEPLLEKVTGTLRFDLKDNGRTARWRVAIKKGDITVSRANEAADCVVRTDRDHVRQDRRREGEPFRGDAPRTVDVEGDTELARALPALFRTRKQS